MMETKMFAMGNKVLSALLMALGFSSCDSEDLPWGGGAVCLYGVPTVTFHAEGTVTDQQQRPLRGIKVKLMETDGEQYAYSIDSVYTDTDGHYITAKSNLTGFDGEILKKRLRVVLEDIDGEANGGAFSTDTLKAGQLEVKQVSKGKGAWDNGTFEVTVNGQMKKQQP